MKKIIIINATLALLLFSSCKKNFLDRQPTDVLSASSLFTNTADATAALTGCYNGWANPLTGAAASQPGWADGYNVLYFDCASDNAFSQYPWEGFQAYGNGLATPGGVIPNGNSDNLYNFVTVQKCNWFLENIDKTPMDSTLKRQYKGEARFLRAYQYFMMSQLYGDVPLVTAALNPADANVVARTPKADVVKFILNELGAIAPDLKQSYTGSDLGRITKGAALSLKARIELYTQDYADCITDCQQVMALGYSLYPSYTDLFRIQHENNSEVILDVQYQENVNNNANASLGVLVSNSYGGWGSIDPVQSLVDSYEMSNGKTIDDASSGYNADNPYVNRDPRFAATIVYPGALYPDASGNQVYYNPLDAASSDFYNSGNNTSVTGYTVKKFTPVLSDFDNLFNSGLNMILLRYAEVLLSYAEAKIEANQIDGTVYDAIDAVRLRAGMPATNRAVYNNQTALRTLVRRERRVELAMEGLRWFDIQRWKTGTEVMNGPVYGSRTGTVNTQTGKVTFTGDHIPVETRVFDANKNYLWPIPQSEMDLNKSLTQNPGY